MFMFNSLSPFYLVQDPSLGNGATQGDQSSYLNHSNPHTQTFPEVMLDSIQLTIEINHHWPLWGFFLIASA